jgi:hypothetical protein
LVENKNEWIKAMDFCYENKDEIGKRNTEKVKDLSWEKLAKKVKVIMEG